MYTDNFMAAVIGHGWQPSWILLSLLKNLLFVSNQTTLLSETHMTETESLNFLIFVFLQLSGLTFENAA